ncbi:MAG: multidrug efflux SMR transporter [Dehalococcoidia bacterium]|nr:multidrug efflux SMR transporter [Dehalococcoidia bacterium]
MKWLILALGIAAEIASVTCMKLAEGFSKWIPSVLTFVFMGIGVAVMIYALKHFDLSFAYTVWAGLGILCVAVIGILFFKEPVTALKIVSIVLVVIGVTGLNIGEVIRH